MNRASRLTANVGGKAETRAPKTQAGGIAGKRAERRPTRWHTFNKIPAIQEMNLAVIHEHRATNPKRRVVIHHADVHQWCLRLNRNAPAGVTIRIAVQVPAHTCRAAHAILFIAEQARVGPLAIRVQFDRPVVVNCLHPVGACLHGHIMGMRSVGGADGLGEIGVARQK